MFASGRGERTSTIKFVLKEKKILLKACAEIAILAELDKRAGISGPGIISSFKSKYSVQMSAGTIYPILSRMEKKKLIQLLPKRRNKTYVLTLQGRETLCAFQINLKEIQDFIVCLVIN